MTIRRIAPLTPDQAAPEVRPIFEAYLRERGNIPNMFRTVAHRPEILRSMIDHFGVISANGALPARLKELLFVRVSQINRCEY